MKLQNCNTFRLVFAQLRDASSVATMLLVEPRANTSSAQSNTSNTLSSAQANSCNRPHITHLMKLIQRQCLVDPCCEQKMFSTVGEKTCASMDNRKKMINCIYSEAQGPLIDSSNKFLIHWLERCMAGNWTKTCRSSNTGRLVEKWDVWVRRNEEVRRTHRKMEWVPMNLLNRIHWNSNMTVGVEDSSLHTDTWPSQLAYSDGLQPPGTVPHSID